MAGRVPAYETPKEPKTRFRHCWWEKPKAKKSVESHPEMRSNRTIGQVNDNFSFSYP